MNSRPLTLCIINYNGAHHLRRAYRAIERQDWRFDEILLIDNGSTDASLALTRSSLPAARIVSLPQNRGPGAARNAGLRAAANDLILFQDNDVELRQSSVARLVDRMNARANCLLAAPRVVYRHAPEVVQFDSADCHWLGLMVTRHADQPLDRLDQAPVSTTSMVSACFLLDRARWNEKPPFDESFEFNLEDHDFGVRACLLGHELWVVPESIVEHGSGTPGLSYRPGVAPSDARLRNLVQNRWAIVAKTFRLKTLVLLAPALLLYELMQFVWLAAGGRAGVWLRGCAGVWGKRREILRERKVLQARRRLEDGQLFRDHPLPLTKHVRGNSLTGFLIGTADRLLRGYYRLVRTRL